MSGLTWLPHQSIPDMMMSAVGAICRPFSIDAPPCINCGRPLEGPTYTGDCASACDEGCYEKAWLALSPNYKPRNPQ
jgi:hypothetical protein